jgi:hypothetical protein
MVNCWGVGSDRESAVGHSQERNTDFLVYDLEHSAFDIGRLGEYTQWLLDRAAIAKSGSITASRAVFVRVPVSPGDESVGDQERSRSGRSPLGVSAH